MPRLLKEMILVFLGLFATVYLIFPTLGIFELIPDAIPLVGSIDEAGATLIIANVLNYYGINLTGLFSRNDATQGSQKTLPGKTKVIRRVRRVPKRPTVQDAGNSDIEDAEIREIDGER